MASVASAAVASLISVAALIFVVSVVSMRSVASIHGIRGIHDIDGQAGAQSNLASAEQQIASLNAQVCPHVCTSYVSLQIVPFSHLYG